MFDFLQVDACRLELAAYDLHVFYFTLERPVCSDGNVQEVVVLLVDVCLPMGYLTVVGDADVAV